MGRWGSVVLPVGSFSDDCFEWWADMRPAVVSRFFFQAEDGIRDLVRSRGLGDVYKRQAGSSRMVLPNAGRYWRSISSAGASSRTTSGASTTCLLYTSDAADERSSVDLGGRRIIKKKKSDNRQVTQQMKHKRNKTI